MSAAIAGAFGLAAPSATSAEMRLRVASAAVAAVACLVLDDDAAPTLAAVPVSRLRQRLARAGFAAAFVATWVLVVTVVADLLTGVGRPPAAALAEIGALGLVALAVACLAIGRTDDGRGGIVGAVVALLCFATAYLPPSWWWPITAQPQLTRLLVIGGGALVVGLEASADPARRRRWRR
jgi:hypothetical protein